MAIFTIQFEGICCHIDLAEAGSPGSVKRRSVLPSVTAHIPYIEMYENDVDEASNPDFQFTAYSRFGSNYKRVELNNAKIELLDVVPSTFTVLPSYDQRIPKLRSIEPRFTTLDPNLLQPTIAFGKVAAYFDMTAGTLSSGPPESFRTVFLPAPPAWPVRHLGQWVQLEVEVSGNSPALRITDLAAGGESLELLLKDGTDLITIGNQTVLDITGLPSPSGHFHHFYDLSATPLINPAPPTPQIGQGLSVGCSDTNWP